MVLRCDAAQTSADFTLSDVFHTVHGAFQWKRGEIHFEPASGKVRGEIMFDATTGHSGSDARDRKMHKDVLESGRYPEISFRPDRVDGKVSASGTSTAQVHGMFGIHGAEHEITVPIVVKLAADRLGSFRTLPGTLCEMGLEESERPLPARWRHSRC